jgi:(p)ppGpp synthase/HD superfamily hydrolase
VGNNKRNQQKIYVVTKTILVNTATAKKKLRNSLKFGDKTKSTQKSDEILDDVETRSPKNKTEKNMYRKKTRMNNQHEGRFFTLSVSSKLQGANSNCRIFQILQNFS